MISDKWQEWHSYCHVTSVRVEIGGSEYFISYTLKNVESYFPGHELRAFVYILYRIHAKLKTYQPLSGEGKSQTRRDILVDQAL